MKDDFIVLTGASKGIGREIAINLAKNKSNLVLIAKDKQRLEETAHLCSKYNDMNYIYAEDLSEQSSIINLVTDILKEKLHITTLINNHGVHYRDLVADIKPEDFRLEKLIDINLRSTITLTRLLLPHIIKSSPLNLLHKAIIYISSLVARNPVATSAAYTASKWGILGFAHALFDEVKNHNVKVSTICPGYVDTDQTDRDQRLGLNPDKMIKAYDIAKTVQFILDFPSSSCPVEVQIRPQFSPFI